MSGELVFGGTLLAAGDFGELGPAVVVVVGDRQIVVSGLSKLEVRGIAVDGLDAHVTISIKSREAGG